MGSGEKSEDHATLPRLPPGISVRLRLRRVPGVSRARANAPKGKAVVLVLQRVGPGQYPITPLPPLLVPTPNAFALGSSTQAWL